MTVKVAVAGATGRLGQQISRLVDEHPGFTLHVAMNSQHDPSEMMGADVLVDATHFSASSKLVRFAIDNGLDAVVATSGWSADRIAEIAPSVAEDQHVLFVPNFSVGSVLATHLAAIAGKFFDSIEIIEAHHEHKVDSPSGTAVRTAETIAAARFEQLSPNHTDQPARGQTVAGIPVHSLRVRGVMADQQVIFGGTGEILTVRHETLAKSAYDHGILLALTRLREHRGITVGLDALLGLSASQQQTASGPSDAAAGVPTPTADQGQLAADNQNVGGHE